MPGAFRVEYVTPEAKQIASYNPARKLLLIINESDYTIYVSKDPVGVSETGIPVYPFESIVFDAADGDEPEYAFFAASPSSTAKVRIYEALVG